MPLRGTNVRAPEDVISGLARAVRAVEAAVQRRRVTPAARTKFQAVALGVRAEHARIQGDQASTPAHRAERQKRLDGVATILAKTAVRDPALLRLIAGDGIVSDAAKALNRDMQRAAGDEPAPEETAATGPADTSVSTERRHAPQSVISRQMASPFLAPDLSSARPRMVGARRLAGWERLDPLLRAFGQGKSGAPACMALPEPTRVSVPAHRELMPHQAKLVAAAAAGHRTFLLADEPGL